MFVPIRSCAPIREIIRLALCLLVACAVPAAAIAATFTVNSVADVLDANPGDGICRTSPSNTVCTLRAAIMEANAFAGADTINLQANATYVLTRVGQDATGLAGDLDVLDSVTIAGAGAASTIIDGNGAVIGDRVIQIFACIGNAPSCAGGVNVVVDISGVTFRNGASDGIYNRGALTLENCSIVDNSGSGIYTNTGTVIVSGSTISGNHTDYGGGVFADSGTVSLVNTTISGNFSDFNGGGIYVISATVGLYNVTIAANQANADGSGSGTGGGVYVVSTPLALANSIISSNEFIPDGGGDFHILDDCAGTLLSQGNNIVRFAIAARCTISGPHSSDNPELGALQNNGGQTMTHALQIGSPAIDGGNSSGCTDNFGATIETDQRGEQRPDGASCDIGAFEYANTIFRDGFELQVL